MRFIPTTLLALLLASAAAHAQVPKPAQPARPAQMPRPAQPARPAVPAKQTSPSDDRAPTEDEELSIAALESLMMQPSARALPILKKVLAGSQSTLVKRRALFVLAQIEAPEARDLLMQTARTSPELRGDAIRSIGISGDQKSLDALQEIYKVGDEDAKKEILQAWMIAGRKEAIFNVAVNAKTEDEA